MSKKLWSVFTDDMEHCYFTGTPYVHRHHIFYGSLRPKSENAPDSVHMNPNHGLDLRLKQMVQKHFEENCGTREDFRRIFGKSWL